TTPACSTWKTPARRKRRSSPTRQSGRVRMCAGLHSSAQLLPRESGDGSTCLSEASASFAVPSGRFGLQLLDVLFERLHSLVQRVDVGAILIRCALSSLRRGKCLIRRGLRMFDIIRARAPAGEESHCGDGKERPSTKNAVHLRVLPLF